MHKDSFNDFNNVYFSRFILICLDILAILLAFIAIFFIMKADYLASLGLCIYGADDPYFFWIFGWIIFVLAALISFPILTSMFIYPMKLFYVSDNGFWSIFYGFIEWNNLKSVQLLNSKCLSFELIDYNLQSLSLFSKLLYQVFRQSRFCLCFWCTNVNVSDVYKFLSEKLKEV